MERQGKDGGERERMKEKKGGGYDDEKEAVGHWLWCRHWTNFSMIAMKSTWIIQEEEVR